MKLITAAANPTYRTWLKLATQPREVRTSGRTLAEGTHLVQAALDAGQPIEAAILRGNGSVPAGWPGEPCLSRLAELGVPLYALAATLYDALGLVENGIGLTVVLRVPRESTVPVTGDALFLDGIQDPGNVGALLRVAAAAGVSHVFAGSGTAALWAPKVLRAAQGTHFALDLREQVSVDTLRAMPVHWIGTVVADSDSLWEIDLPRTAVGWVLGAEGQGASADALSLCAQRLRIPLAPGVESLNVATAAAVCLFERRRRLIQGTPTA
jgi:RNA methyltransferase, TrmH family